jgi:hypothetical protein
MGTGSNRVALGAADATWANVARRVAAFVPFQLPPAANWPSRENAVAERGLLRSVVYAVSIAAAFFVPSASGALGLGRSPRALR